MNFRTSVRGGLVVLSMALASAPFVNAININSEELKPRDRTIYLGLNLTVDYAGVACPVVWADYEELEIVDPNGKHVYLERKTNHIQAHAVPRVARTRLSVEEVGSRRVNTRAEVANIESLQQQMMMQNIQQEREQQAAMKQAEADKNFRFEKAQLEVNHSMFTSQKTVDALQASADSASQVLDSTIVAPQLDFQNRISNNDANALEMTFSLSAPVEVGDAAGVLRLYVRDPANPRVSIATVRFFQIRNLGTKPTRVRVLQDGLPIGYKLENYALNVFANGAEIPTSMSQNSTAVTADDAFSFLELQHMQDHPQGSAPAVVAPALVEPSLRSLVSDEIRSRTVGIETDASGKVTRVEPSPSAGPALSPQVLEILSKARLLPALENGKPVAGHGTYALFEFLEQR